MPRSGTTLVEQIISNHSEVYGAGELDLLPISVKNSDWSNSNDFDNISQKIRNEYLKKLSLLSKKKFITFFYYLIILMYLPNLFLYHI